MLIGAGGRGAIAGSLDTLVDDTVGIISRLEAVPAPPGTPAFHHFEARICDAAAFGGPANGGITSAASADRETALTETAAAAIARYAAALYDREQLPLASHREADFPTIKPSDFALFSDAQYGSPGFPYVPATDDTPLRWSSAIDLLTGEDIHVPAAFVFHPFPYRRLGGDMPIAPPNSAGLACAEGIAEAALAGLADILRQDALALFWQAQIMPPQLARDALSEPIRDMVRRFEASGDRLFLLDIATDNSLPAFLAIVASERPERPAFALDAGADLDAEAAVMKALRRLAETRRRSQAALAQMVAATPANDWEDMTDPVDHLLFAADHANRQHFEFALASEIRRDIGEYEPRSAASVEADLELVVRLISATGHRAYAANLTSDDIATFGINICRVLVPGYVPIHATHRLRSLGGDRLYETPRRLGYRGIGRGSQGNPAPHPFAC
jgi:ribosomal protein S12 methylthiotransferase accessory factor